MKICVMTWIRFRLLHQQRHTPDSTSPDGRVRSGRASYGPFSERVYLSSQDIQEMVEEEVETVSRELAEEPSLALLDLTETRGDMDEMAMRAQVNSKEIRHGLYMNVRCTAKLVVFVMCYFNVAPPLLWTCRG